MTITAMLEADLVTLADVAVVGARTVVALPPSDADPIWDEMRVAMSGRLISRAFDPGAPIVTGAPIALRTEAGDIITTEAADHIISEVAV